MRRQKMQRIELRIPAGKIFAEYFPGIKGASMVNVQYDILTNAINFAFTIPVCNSKTTSLATSKGKKKP